MPPESEPQRNLDAFQCRRCNECCRQPGFVYLKPQEEDRLAAFLKMDPFDFVNQYCELEGRRLVLKKLPDESCIFLTEAGCRVHPAKPSQCVDFPSQWRTARSWDYCQGLQEL